MIIKYLIPILVALNLSTFEARFLFKMSFVSNDTVLVGKSLFVALRKSKLE